MDFRASEEKSIPRADVRIGAAPSVTEILIGLVALGGTLVVVDRYVPAPRPVQVLNCPAPAAGNVTVITVQTDAGRASARCTEAMSRGSYAKSARK